MNAEFIKKYEKLIYHMFRFREFEHYPNKEDLFQEGVIGLMKAYENFDPSLNVKFSTFAYKSIWGEMMKLVREDRSIKVSRNITKLNLQIERAMVVLSQTYGREPSVDELVAYLGVTPYELREALLAKYQVQSIDEPILSDGKEMSLHDTIADPSSGNLDELLALREQLEHLTPKERTLIEARYLSDMTQTEVSQVMGMSQVQVSREESKVKKKIQMGLMQ